VQRGNDGWRQRLGDIADAAADKAFSGFRVVLAKAGDFSFK